MDKKYELTGDTRFENGVEVHRIRRLFDGELGGWIESEKNLNQGDHAWVFDDSVVLGDARVSGASRVFQSSIVKDRARLAGAVDVCGGSVVGGDVQLSGAIWIQGKQVLTQGDVLYVGGLMFPVTVFRDGTVVIGCETRPISEWVQLDETDFPQVEDQVGLARMRAIVIPLLQHLATSFVQS